MLRRGKGMITLSSAAARAITIAAIIQLGGFSLFAADLKPQASPTDIVVLVDPVQKNGESFRQLVADAAEYKLSSLGVAAQVVAASPAEAAKPLPQALAHGATVALVCTYDVEGQQMDVTLGWYDSKATTAAVTVQATGPVDLHLDSVILAALDQILAKVEDRIRALSASRSQENTRASQEATPAGFPGVTVIGPRAAQPVSKPMRRLLLSGGFAPFLPTGAAAYYFSLGYLPSVLATYFVDTPVGPVGLGLYAGMDYFTAVGSQDYANTYLLPLGVDARYEVGQGLLRPFFHVAGGPALMIMVTGTQGTITNVLPFLKSGIGLEVMVSQELGISALADYDVYFENPYLVTGFSPSMNLELHL